MRKLIVIVVGLFVVFALGAYTYFTPHLTLKRIQAAANEDNSSELAQHVDLDKVRASLKRQIRERVDSSALRSNNPFAQLGSALAGALTEPAVDAIVTPDNIAKLLRGEGFGVSQGHRVRFEGSSVDMDYDGWHRFIVSTGSGAGFRFVMEREGALGWKLTDVILPETWTLQAAG